MNFITVFTLAKGHTWALVSISSNDKTHWSALE